MHSMLQGGPSVIRLPDVLQATGLSRATIYRLINEEAFPKQFKLGSSSVGWLVEDVFEWIRERASLRDVSPMMVERKRIH